jgi:hypothetical protein
MIKNTEAGFASIQFLFLLFLLSALAAGISLYSYSYTLIDRRIRRTNQNVKEMNAILGDIIFALQNDASPDINSNDDSVWHWHSNTVNGYKVTLNPISDRLNLNYARKNVFDKTALSLLFGPGKTSADLQQFREDNGLSLFTSDYKGFFAAEDLARYFSCYGWANINLIDEFAARSLALSLTGSVYKAERLRTTIEKLLMEKQLVDGKSLPFILGMDYDELFPFVNAEALINVNYIDKTLLAELLAYPDYNVSSPGRRTEELLSRRTSGGVAAKDIPVMLGIDPQSPLIHYLGSVTWFWEVIISGGNAAQRTVLCRLPPSGGSQTTTNVLTDVAYQIIEQRYTHAAP